MAFVGLVLDICVIAALGVGIYFAVRLSKQIAQMQADKRAFESLIQALNVAASRAESAIRALKDAAGGTGDMLQEKINTARAMSGELEIIVQAADNVADRLSQLAASGSKGGSAERPEASASPDQAPRTKAEKDLLDAVKSRQK